MCEFLLKGRQAFHFQRTCSLRGTAGLKARSVSVRVASGEASKRVAAGAVILFASAKEEQGSGRV